MADGCGRWPASPTRCGSRARTRCTWGLVLDAAGVEPWPALLDARDWFESDLPVRHPKTEPDIALWIPGRALPLIEAKFTSPNGVYHRDREARLLDLTFHQLLQLYQDPSLQWLDVVEADRRHQIHYQLRRNLVFAEWMARGDGCAEHAFVNNLVRAGHEEVVCAEVLTLMSTIHRDRFQQNTWEDLYAVLVDRCGADDPLASYLRRKTTGLRPVFRLPPPPPPRPLPPPEPPATTPPDPTRNGSH